MGIRQKIIVKILLAICKILSPKYGDGKINAELLVIDELITDLKEDIAVLEDPKYPPLRAHQM